MWLCLLVHSPSFRWYGVHTYTNSLNGKDHGGFHYGRGHAIHQQDMVILLS